MRRPIRSSKNSASKAPIIPTWDKVYGDPSEPATSIIFGEKGSGKTAMRLQLARHLEQHNERHPAGGCSSFITTTSTRFSTAFAIG